MQSSLEPSLVAKLLVRTSSLRCDFVQLGGWQKESSFVIPACWEVFPNEQTWHFPRIPLEHGGKWNGDDIVADLEDFKRDAERASIHQVKKMYCSPKEQWTFPMLAVYDKQTRSVCVSDPAMQVSGPRRVRSSMPPTCLISKISMKSSRLMSKSGCPMTKFELLERLHCELNPPAVVGPTIGNMTLRNILGLTMSLSLGRQWCIQVRLQDLLARHLILGS